MMRSLPQAAACIALALMSCTATAADLPKGFSDVCDIKDLPRGAKVLQVTGLTETSSTIAFTYAGNSKAQAVKAPEAASVDDFSFGLAKGNGNVFAVLVSDTVSLYTPTINGSAGQFAEEDLGCRPISPATKIKR